MLTTASHGATLNRGKSVCSVMSMERDRSCIGELESPPRLQVCPFIHIHISSHDCQSVLISTTWGILRHPRPPDTQSQQRLLGLLPVPSQLDTPGKAPSEGALKATPSDVGSISGGHSGLRGASASPRASLHCKLRKLNSVTHARHTIKLAKSEITTRGSPRGPCPPCACDAVHKCQKQARRQRARLPEFRRPLGTYLTLCSEYRQSSQPANPEAERHITATLVTYSPAQRFFETQWVDTTVGLFFPTQKKTPHVLLLSKLP